MGALYSSNHRRQLVDQAVPLNRLLGHIAAWLIEVGSLRLRHRAFALGKALFLELFDRARTWRSCQGVRLISPPLSRSLLILWARLRRAVTIGVDMTPC